VSLKASDIAEIAKLLSTSQFASLDLTMGEFKLRIRRDGGGSRRDEDDEPSPAPSAAPEPAEAPPIGQEAGAARVGEVDVPAPLLGNFYTAPRPGDPPFVEPGDAVDEETVIGIIEVMKLMNPIRAGVRGTVVALLVANGTAIEEGQALIRVRLGD
jgi:acetyl-CoA carboxylase biotin carboxyl carrier protein